jgi:polyisoprenoid-binding protein YceI
LKIHTDNESWGTVSIALHWLTAAVVVVMFGLGIWMVGLGYYSAWYYRAPFIHKSVGLLLAGALAGPINAEEYIMDTEKGHAFIAFRANHLVFSWVLGRFNTFTGRFSYDENNPESFFVEATIDTASIDTNQAERDKHLRSADFLHVDKYPQAKFVSTGFKEDDDGTGTLTGDLTFRGVTLPVNIDFEHMGHGEDPWGNFRRGFSGKTMITLQDFGTTFDLGPQTRQVELFFSVEGIRQ